MSRVTIVGLAVVSCLLPWATRTTAAAQRGVGGLGITVFADADFRGESANFRNDVSDLTKYRMNDIISSLRVAQGETWEACVDKNYKGRCQIFSGSEANLDRIGWNDTISSLRRVRTAASDNGYRSQARPRLTFYDRPDFRGNSRTVTDSVPNLGFFSNRAGSLRVEGGSWEVCDGPRFTGRCLAVSRDVADLSRFGLDGQISSARPR